MSDDPVSEKFRHLLAEIRKKHHVPDGCPICTNCMMPVNCDEKGRMWCNCHDERKSVIDEEAAK